MLVCTTMLKVWICDYYYYADSFRAKKNQLAKPKAAFESGRVLDQIDMEHLQPSSCYRSRAIDHTYFNANIGMHWNAVQNNNGSACKIKGGCGNCYSNSSSK